MSGWTGFVRNPVFLREVRVRMRGWRTPGIIVLYVGLLGLLAILIFVAAMQGSRPTGFAPEAGAVIYVGPRDVPTGAPHPGRSRPGRRGDRRGAGAADPGPAAGHPGSAPAQVVVGKLLAATGFALLLMFASLPVFGLIFLFGGFSLSRLGLSAVVYVVTVLLLGAVSLYFSALYRRTQTAVVAAYGVVTTWTLLSPLFGR